MISQKQKNERLEVFRTKCRANGLSVTPQRKAIYEILADAKDHPRAEDVYERLQQSHPEISLDTVYRTLGTFSELGFIHLVEGYGEARRYDPDMDPHHHFRCIKCGRIVDFHDDTFDRLKVPAAFQKKYRVASVKVVLEGFCEICMKTA